MSDFTRMQSTNFARFLGLLYMSNARYLLIHTEKNETPKRMNSIMLSFVYTNSSF